VLKAVRPQPGKTLGEYVAMLGLSKSALYRPLRELTNDRVVKRARQPASDVTAGPPQRNPANDGSRASARHIYPEELPERSM
jgi:hypothetical protein